MVLFHSVASSLHRIETIEMEHTVFLWPELVARRKNGFEIWKWKGECEPTCTLTAWAPKGRSPLFLSRDITCAGRAERASNEFQNALHICQEISCNPFNWLVCLFVVPSCWILKQKRLYKAEWCLQRCLMDTLVLSNWPSVVNTKLQ